MMRPWMRTLRSIAAVLAAVAGLALLSAWLLPQFLNWDHYRSAIERVASTALGRPVQIGGAIRLSLLPEATLTASDVTLSDIGDGASAEAGEIRVRVALEGLLTGRLKPQDLVLSNPALHLPWPLKPVTLRADTPLGGLHAKIANGQLWVGGLQVSGINGELGVDPATGTLSASGLATVMARPWRMTGRLGRPGADGSFTVEISLDGQGAEVGTGAALSGQVDAQGELVGQVSGRGPDLSLLLPAPAQAWHADGRITAGSGLAVADDLDFDIGGAPARGAVALRLLPALRLDVALEASRMSLDDWLPPLLHGGRTALPTGIDLSAQAATLAGGTLRQLRAGFEMAQTSVAVRSVEAVLPGDATVAVSGTLTGSQFRGAGVIAMPDVAQTLAWLRPQAPAIAAALPQGMVHAAHLTASVAADPHSLALSKMEGDADGVKLTGEVALRGGTRPSLTGKLQLAGPTLDGRLPDGPVSLAELAARLSALPVPFAALDADLAVNAAHPVWHGQTLDQAELALHCQGGAVTLERASLTGPDLSISLSGEVEAGGRVSGGRLDVTLGQTEALGARLPAGWRAAAGLLRGRGTLSATAAGPPGALAIAAVADVSDGEAQAHGVLDLAGAHWKGGVALHHPGAPRMLAALGLPNATSWLGDGSLSFQANADVDAQGAAFSSLGLSAGLLHMNGDIQVKTGGARPVVTGVLEADTLPMPLPPPRSANPWPLDVLHALDGKVTMRAAHLLWTLAPFGDAAAATISLNDGDLRVDGFTGTIAGGRFAGRVEVNAASPPTLAVAGTLNGAVLDEPAFGTPLDLASGTADMTIDVSAAGYSPAGLLAKLTGSVRASVLDGSLAGLDEGRLLAALQTVGDFSAVRNGAADALHSGTTPFSKLDLTGSLANGVLTLQQAAIVAPSGPIGVTGSVDLPGNAMDLRLALRPAVTEANGPAPTIGLRLIGPVDSATRTPELAELTRWLSAKQL